jgi:hypothetical protein
MFVPIDQWDSRLCPQGARDRRGLKLDYKDNPGFYASMMRAMNLYLRKPSFMAKVGRRMARLTADGYVEMHRTLTTGVFRRSPDNSWMPMPHEWSGTGTDFTVAQIPRHFIDPAALEEIFQNRIAAWSPTYLAGVHDQLFPQPPHAPPWLASELALGKILRPADGGGSFPIALYYLQTKTGGTLRGFTLWDTSIDAERNYVQAVLNYYYKTLVPKVRDDKSARLAVAWAVRSLHIGHVYDDGDEPLNTVLVLNRLLIELGQSPSIIADPSVFNGRGTRAWLAELIEAGQHRFQVVVQQAY